MMFSLSGSYTLNDIVSKTVYDQQTGAQRTTYENINGNYNLNARAMLNTPLRNKRFSLNSNTSASFRNTNSFLNGERNRSRILTLSERAGADFRSDFLDLGLNASIRFSANTNSLQPENNLRTFNYDVGGYTTLYLPWDIRLESDITWSTNSGYSDGYKQNEVLWNAALSKSFLRGNQGTLRFKIYDILQQRSNISRTVSSTMIADRQYNGYQQTVASAIRQYASGHGKQVVVMAYAACGADAAYLKSTGQPCASTSALPCPVPNQLLKTAYLLNNRPVFNLFIVFIIRIHRNLAFRYTLVFHLLQYTGPEVCIGPEKDTDAPHLVRRYLRIFRLRPLAREADPERTQSVNLDCEAQKHECRQNVEEVFYHILYIAHCQRRAFGDLPRQEVDIYLSVVHRDGKPLGRLVLLLRILPLY